MDEQNCHQRAAATVLIARCALGLCSVFESQSNRSRVVVETTTA